MVKVFFFFLYRFYMRFTPEVHNLYDHYIRYQADNGAQAVQIFDSWATELSPVDFEEFSLPYLKHIVEAVKHKLTQTYL